MLTCHQAILPAVFKTVVLRINQWNISINTITTITFIISTVASNGGPVGGVCPDMERNSVHACPKVAERKNTQVMHISKKVSSAYKNPAGFLPVRSGPREAVAMTGA